MPILKAPGEEGGDLSRCDSCHGYGRRLSHVGGPGTGKTILGSEFLSTGLKAGENVLFIHGKESKKDVITNAGRVGIDLEGADFLDLGPESEFFAEERSYDPVDPQDIEQEGYIGDIREAVEEADPNGCSSTRSASFSTSKPASTSSASA